MDLNGRHGGEQCQPDGEAGVARRTGGETSACSTAAPRRIASARSADLGHHFHVVVDEDQRRSVLARQVALLESGSLRLHGDVGAECVLWARRRSAAPAASSSPSQSVTRFGACRRRLVKSDASSARTPRSALPGRSSTRLGSCSCRAGIGTAVGDVGPSVICRPIERTGFSDVIGS